jgi:hypothetical protein
MSDIVMTGFATLVFGLIFTIATSWLGGKSPERTLPPAE